MADRSIQVLDASVLVKWLVDEEGRERTLDILEDVVQRPRTFAVPSLVWYELTNVLVRVTGKVDRADRNLERVMHLGIPCFPRQPSAAPAPCGSRSGRGSRATTRITSYWRKSSGASG